MIHGQNMIKSGWMYKQGWWNTAYKQRYFEFNENAKTLRYYIIILDGSGTNKRKLKGRIDFKKTPIKRMVKSFQLERQFHVVTKAREWIFRCENRQERDEWYCAISTLWGSK